jgi:hypothetical protein
MMCFFKIAAAPELSPVPPPPLLPLQASILRSSGGDRKRLPEREMKKSILSGSTVLPAAAPEATSTTIEHLQLGQRN